MYEQTYFIEHTTHSYLRNTHAKISLGKFMYDNPGGDVDADPTYETNHMLINKRNLKKGTIFFTLALFQVNYI